MKFHLLGTSYKLNLPSLLFGLLFIASLLFIVRFNLSNNPKLVTISDSIFNSPNSSLQASEIQVQTPDTVALANSKLLSQTISQPMPAPLSTNQIVDGSIRFKLNSRVINSQDLSPQNSLDGKGTFLSTSFSPLTEISIDPDTQIYTTQRSFITLFFPPNPEKLNVTAINLNLQVLCPTLNQIQAGSINIYKGNWDYPMPTQEDQVWNQFDPSIVIGSLEFSQDCSQPQNIVFPINQSYKELAGSVTQLVLIDSQEADILNTNASSFRRLQSISINSFLELVINSTL